MNIFATIRTKPVSEQLAMLLSMLAHIGIGVVLAHAWHGVGGAASKPVEVETTIVTLMSAVDVARGNDKISVSSRQSKPESKDIRSMSETSVVQATSQPELVPQSRLQEAETVSDFHIVVPPKPYYFQPNELTEQPEVVVDISSDLSPILSSGVAQLAILNLFINEDGDIDEVVVENSLLSEPAQHLMKDAFSKTQFTPGKVAGLAVKSQLRIEVMLEGLAVEKIKSNVN